MRVLHYLDTTDLKCGGPPRMAMDCCRALAAQGHRCTILVPDTTDAPREWLDAESGGFGMGGEGLCMPRVHRIPEPTLPGGFFTRGALQRIRSELERTDVLHLHCVWSPVAHQLAAMARDIGLPYVVTLHGMLDDWSMSQKRLKKRLVLSLAARNFLEHATRVHCTAQTEYDQSCKWFPRGKAAIVPVLIDLAPYIHLPGRGPAEAAFGFLKDRSEPTILFLSRLHYKKGCEHLIRAAASLRNAGVNARFVFAGSGEPDYVQSLKDLAGRLDIADNCHFVGQVEGLQKVSLYQASDLFVLPSSQENLGIALVEAMACGVPVVTTKGVDIWHDLEDNDVGSIVGDPAHGLAEEIRRLVKDPRARREMGARAREWALREFDADSIRRRFEDMYAQSAVDSHFGAGGRRAPQRLGPERPRARPI
jgi:glycosyltransferase involved in cell wall biosynthesis